MTPRCNENLKNLAVKPALPPRSSGDEWARERRFSEVCFERWKDMEVRPPPHPPTHRVFRRGPHLPEHRPPSAHPRRLVCFDASELMHYRSGRHHRSRPAKSGRQFSSHGLFLYKAVIHIQQHLKGVMQHQSKMVVYSFFVPLSWPKKS